MQPLRPTIPKSQTPRGHNQRRNPQQMQPRLGLENAVVPLTVPVRVAVDEPAAGPRAEQVAQQAGDVDQANDGGAKVVRGDLEQKGREDVDCDDPGEGDAVGVMC